MAGIFTLKLSATRSALKPATAFLTDYLKFGSNPEPISQNSGAKIRVAVMSLALTKVTLPD